MSLYLGNTRVAGGNILSPNEMVARVVDALYPVGAIFINTTNTDPSEDIGMGLWSLEGTSNLGITSKTYYIWTRVG